MHFCQKFRSDIDYLSVFMTICQFLCCIGYFILIISIFLYLKLLLEWLYISDYILYICSDFIKMSYLL